MFSFALSKQNESAKLKMQTLIRSTRNLNTRISTGLPRFFYTNLLLQKPLYPEFEQGCSPAEHQSPKYSQTLFKT